MFILTSFLTNPCVLHISINWQDCSGLYDNVLNKVRRTTTTANSKLKWHGAQEFPSSHSVLPVFY